MTKEVIAKAIILTMQDKMLEIQSTVANSIDMKAIAKAYRDMADLVEEADIQLEELEKSDDQ